MTYHLHVIASTPSDVVINAGGWLFDQVMAGWQTKVMVADGPHSRAIQILGAALADLDPTGESLPAEGCYVLAVAADLYGRDAQVRHVIRKAMRHDGAELLLWDKPSRSSDKRLAHPIHHRLSGAARAFKAEALAAAGAGTVMVGSTETLFPAVVERSSVAKLVVGAQHATISTLPSAR